MSPRSATAQPPAKRQEPAPLARVQQREAHPLVAAINERMPAIVQMLPASMDAQRFSAVLLQALVKHPDILTCTPESVISAVIEAAQDGLEPTGARGGAHLVKFGNEAVLIRDYRGVIRILVESGAVKAVEAHEVKRGDLFRLRYGATEPVEHEVLVPNTEGETLGYYALFTRPDGSRQAEFMDTAQIETVRKTSKQPGGLGWKDFPGQMARKTVIKRGANYLNLRPEVRARLMREDEAEYGEAGILVERIPSPELAASRQRIADRTARLTGGNQQPGPARTGDQGKTDMGEGHRSAQPAASSASSSAPVGTPAPASKPCTKHPDSALETVAEGVRCKKCGHLAAVRSTEQPASRSARADGGKAAQAGATPRGQNNGEATSAPANATNRRLHAVAAKRGWDHEGLRLVAAAGAGVDPATFFAGYSLAGLSEEQWEEVAAVVDAIPADVDGESTWVGNAGVEAGFGDPDTVWRALDRAFAGLYRRRPQAGPATDRAEWVALALWAKAGLVTPEPAP